MALSLARHNPIVVLFFTKATALLSSLFRFESSFSAFYLVVLQSWSAGTDTCPLLCIPIQFCRIDIREDASTHRAISCKYI